MTSDLWASIIATVVIPILLRVLVHYFPWLADAVTWDTTTPKPAPRPPADPELERVELDPEEGS